MTVQGPFEGCELSWAMAFRTLIGKSWTKVGLVTVWWNRSLFLIILYKYSLLTWRSFFIQVECNSSFFNAKVVKCFVKSLVYMHAYFWKVEKYYKTISLFLQQNQQFFRQINVFTKEMISRKIFEYDRFRSTFPHCGFHSLEIAAILSHTFLAKNSWK